MPSFRRDCPWKREGVLYVTTARPNHGKDRQPQLSLVGTPAGRMPPPAKELSLAAELLRLIWSEVRSELITTASVRAMHVPGLKDKCQHLANM